MGYRHKLSRKIKRNQPHKRSKTMQIVRKSYARKLKLPKNPRKKKNLASMGGASGSPLVLFRTSFPFRKQKADT
jgi:hypothetical protein